VSRIEVSITKYYFNTSAFNLHNYTRNRLLRISIIIFMVETKDALLHAINEEYVEAVEVLLDHEETIHVEGKLHVIIL
ncbi:Transient receptor potential-gamma protein, partial [Armadillidium nasatum]